ncbi:MAG: PqiC family protein, partial [Methylococcaceae bacterium]|nr:PqiC family protein [Methylococcaceae bacterium]
LNPVSSPAASIRLPQNTGVIGLGPVRIPKYLDRPQVVTRTDRNRIGIDDAHQWAGPLKEDVARVIRENLSLLLGGHHTIAYPWKNTEGVAYQIQITIQRLDVENRLAVLQADWSIADLDSPDSGKIDRSDIETPVSGNHYADKVSAINESLNRFSLAVANGFADFIAGHRAARKRADTRSSD